MPGGLEFFLTWIERNVILPLLALSDRSVVSDITLSGRKALFSGISLITDGN